MILAPIGDARATRVSLIGPPNVVGLKGSLGRTNTVRL